MKKFIDPLDVLDPKTGKEPSQTRTSIVYPSHIMSALVSARYRTGTMQTTVNILLTKLADELKRNGNTDYDPDAYEHAVANCTIILGSAVAITAAGPVNASTAKTAGGNDGSRTLGMGRKATGDADKPADIRSASKGNSGKRS